jgi:hypothetical protein
MGFNGSPSLAGIPLSYDVKNEKVSLKIIQQFSFFDAVKFVPLHITPEMVVSTGVYP